MSLNSRLAKLEQHARPNVSLWSVLAGADPAGLSAEDRAAWDRLYAPRPDPEPDPVEQSIAEMEAQALTTTDSPPPLPTQDKEDKL